MTLAQELAFVPFLRGPAGQIPIELRPHFRLPFDGSLSPDELRMLTEGEIA